MNRSKSEERVSLKLTAAERVLLLENLTAPPAEFQQAIRAASTSKPILLTLDQAKELSRRIAFDADHPKTKKVQKTLDVLSGKLQHLICSQINQEPPRVLKFEGGEKEKPIGRPKPAPVKSVPSGQRYQFKIKLAGSEPPIWRRIQVADCTLDKLHEYIQTSMGWTNSHLHHFRLGKQLYGDPMLMAENMAEMDYKDSTRTKLSKILPKSCERFRFVYEYDFGDSWEHEILFEGIPKTEADTKCPVCLEGERACPPEDVGGIGGFYELLEGLADPRHEQHDDFKEWIGEFDPEKFDAKQATKEMKKGVPNWRE